MRATVTGATSGTRRRPWRRPADALRSRCGAGLGPVMRSHPATAPRGGLRLQLGVRRAWASPLELLVTCSAKFVDAPELFTAADVHWFRRSSDALALSRNRRRRPGWACFQAPQRQRRRLRDRDEASGFCCWHQLPDRQLRSSAAVQRGELSTLPNSSSGAVREVLAEAQYAIREGAMPFANGIPNAACKRRTATHSWRTRFAFAHKRSRLV